MTDKPLESAAEPQEPDADATAAPSVPSLEQPPSPFSGLDVETLAEKLAPHLAESLRPEWQKDDQSVKDRRIAGLTDDVARLKSYMTKSGGDVDKAVREMQIDDMLAGRSESKVPGRTESGSSGLQAAMQAVSTEILSGAEIDFEDPEYVALTKQYAGRINDAENWRAVAQAFADRRTTKTAKQEGVTSAATVGASGVASVASDDADTVAAELDGLLDGRQTPATQKRIAELTARVEELEPTEQTGVFGV